MRLLYINDGEHAESVAKAFEGSNVELVICENALCALDLMGRENFDFILVEPMLSPFEGEAVGSWISEHLKTPWSLLCDPSENGQTNTISNNNLKNLPRLIAEQVSLVGSQ